MTAQEFQSKQRLLRHYDAMLKSPAYLELRGKIQEEFDNAITGLRNRKISRDERQEFQEAADAAERLLAYPEERIKALTKETSLSQQEIEAMREEFTPEAD